MSEPAKGLPSGDWWETRYEGESYAVLPAAAQVVEMPVADGEPPCVYVRGQRVIRWEVRGVLGVLYEAYTEQEAHAAMARAHKSFSRGVPMALHCVVEVKTRTKEEPARE